MCHFPRIQVVYYNAVHLYWVGVCAFSRSEVLWTKNYGKCKKLKPKKNRHSNSALEQFVIYYPPVTEAVFSCPIIARFGLRKRSKIYGPYVKQHSLSSLNMTFTDFHAVRCINDILLDVFA